MTGFYLDTRGEFFSAKVLAKRDDVPNIKPLRSRQFLSMREQLTLSSKGISVALHASFFNTEKQDIENYLTKKQQSGTTFYEVSDREWLYSVVGTNVKRIIPDYQALANLTSLLPSCEKSLLLYEESDHLCVVLIEENSVQSVNRLNLNEVHSVGISPLLERLLQHYKKQGLTPTLPEKKVLIGTISQPISQGIPHFWETVSLSHLKAAGTTIRSSHEQLIHLHKKRNLLRYFRRIVTTASTLLLFATIILTYQLSKIVEKTNPNAATAFFSPQEIRDIDSLQKITEHLQKEVQLSKEHHRWDLILATLGRAAKKHKVSLARFGSRTNENAIELLLRGEAKNEKSVNQFINALENDERIVRVTLTQIDKKDSNYEFSLQCLTTI